ncbi:SMP-30/gluconolactonase/LRE family protein [Microbacterium sp. NPDC089320]|uniref:SMP-30/gluconolactonase/LRE family protein n=1 Tax=Microbacterium sp. NPDC089320 TaxID=3155182 RepID=UPI0034344FDB
MTEDTSHPVRVATAQSHFLAEGPTWDAERSRLLWVDIMAGIVHIGHLSDDDLIVVDERVEFPDTAGAVAVDPDGRLLVAGTHRLFVRELDGRITGGPELIDGAERRFNDGKPDPRGRYVVGTKGEGETDTELLLVVEGGAARVIDDDLTLSNGLAWSADGRTLYSVDTLRRRIHVREYDPATGDVGARRVLTEFADGGYPDGLTVDETGDLWVAMWGDGCVLRLSPEGAVVSRVDLPVPHVSCPTFAGDDLDVLVITTATEGMTAEQRASHPLAGRLFTARPGVRGLPAHHWNRSRVLEGVSKGIA